MEKVGSRNEPGHKAICLGGYEDGFVRSFEVESGKVMLKVQPHKCSVTALATADNGKRLSWSTSYHHGNNFDWAVMHHTL